MNVELQTRSSINQGAGRFVDFRDMHTRVSSSQAMAHRDFFPGTALTCSISNVRARCRNLVPLDAAGRTARKRQSRSPLRVTVIHAWPAALLMACCPAPRRGAT
jgi:hypothetical protein